MRKRIRLTVRVLSALALIGLIGMVAGCSKSAAESSTGGAAVEAASAEGGRSTSKDVLIFANLNDVGTLDPYADTAMQRVRVTDQVYEPLFYLNSDGSYTPALATSWEWQDDTHLLLNLREGVKFHNGNPFTVDDILYSFALGKANTIGGQLAKFDLENSEVIDDHTLILAFTEPDGLAMARLGGTFVIMDKETVEPDPESIPSWSNGTGPYELVEWVTGDSVTLRRNDGYWGEKAIITTLVFRNVSEITQRTIELQTGGVDFAFDMSPTAVEEVKSDPNLALYTQASTLVNNIMINSTPGHVFANEDLRKALASAISAPDIIKGAYDGSGSVPTSYVSSAAPGFDSALTEEPWPQDLDAARAYMEASGVPEGTVINVVVDDRSQRVATCEIIKNQLAQIGLVANIQQYDFGTAIGTAMNLGGPWDLYLLGNAGATASLQAMWLDGTVGFVAYHASANGAELVEMVKELHRTTDNAKQVELNNRIQVYVNEHVVLYPVQQSEVLYGYNARLKGVAEGIQSFAVVLCKDLYFE